MRIVKLFLIMALSMSLVNHSFCQQKDEALIRQRENMEREAILKGDTIQLSNLVSRKIVVQNPENAFVGFRQIIDRIKTGKIDYSLFERRIDTVAFMNGIAVVMGLETLIPKGSTQNAGKTIQRRFTNVWTKEHGDWKLTARQATIVSAK